MSAGAMGKPTWRKTTILQLYRSILKEHKAVLPPALRMMGDEYVKKEFRHHKNVSPEVATEFLMQWKSYLTGLEEQAASIRTTPEMDEIVSPVGQDLSPEALNSLTDEQVGQLSVLKEEATKVLKKKGLKKT
eukprot:Nk52_evm5s128 gene=Nk52_evmTU5s128